MIKQLNDYYFRGMLRSDVLELLADAACDGVRRYELERMFYWMKRSGYTAIDITLLLARWIGVALDTFFPQVRSGMIPHTTFARRHQDLDDYLSERFPNSFRRGATFLDVGCGVPPETTIEIATKFPEMEFIAIEPNPPSVVILDSVGDYAWYDDDGTISFVQAHPGKSAEAVAMKFAAYYRQWSESSKHGIGDSCADFRVFDFRKCNGAAKNWMVARGALFDDLSGKHAIVRMMNVLTYYHENVRKSVLRWAATLSQSGGVVLIGSNFIGGCECRASVFQIEDLSITESRYVFSLDNLFSIGLLPWVDITRDGFEVRRLAWLCNMLRSEDSFVTRLRARVDALHVKHGTFWRSAEGYLISPDIYINPSHLFEIQREICDKVVADGFSAEAALILARNGLDTSCTRAGLIEVNARSLLEHGRAEVTW